MSTPRGRAFNVLSTGQSSQSKLPRNRFYGHVHWFGVNGMERSNGTTVHDDTCDAWGGLRGVGDTVRQLLNGTLFSFENQRAILPWKYSSESVVPSHSHIPRLPNG